MTSIICKAYFLNPAETTIIAVSPSFQAALTPWLLTLAAKQYYKSLRVAEIKCYSLSSTFQYTTGLSVSFQSNEEQQRLMNSDLCTPLFSHLKTFVMQYKNAGAFDDGNAVADFVLKFQRLEDFRLILNSESTTPTELIAFYMRLFHSQNISQTLLISVVKSYAENIIDCNYYREKSSDYASLIKQHKIIPFLVQKMLEVYRSDHGETLVVFLKAILCSFVRSGAWTESDSIDDLVLMLDLIETIVINGDLFHPCFQPEQDIATDPEDQKWILSKSISVMLYTCLRSANYSRLDFMQRYGRTLLPQLLDYIFSKYDGSKSALETSAVCVELFFGVMDDYLWTDQVESKQDEAGLKKMLVGGRRLLQNIPFDKLGFVFKQAIKCSTGYQKFNIRSIGVLNNTLMNTYKYCAGVARLSPHLQDAVARDVSSQQLVRYNIVPLFFDLVLSCFNRRIEEEGADELLKNSLGAVSSFLQPAAVNLYRHLLVVSQDFFSRVGILDKLSNFSREVCSHCRGVWRELEHAIEKNFGECSEAELKLATSKKRRAELFFGGFIPRLESLLLATRSISPGERQNREVPRQIYPATIQVRDLSNYYNTFLEENKDKLKLF